MPVQVTVENLLRWNTDNASVAAAIKANQSVAQSMSEASRLTAEGAAATGSAGLVNTELQQTLAGQTSEMNRQVGLANRLSEAAKVRENAETGTLAALRSEAFGGGGRGDNTNVVRSLSSARAAAIALPGVGYQSPLVVGIRGLGLIAEKTNASFTQLAAGVGIAGVAIAAVVVAFDRFNLELEGSKRALNAALSANEKYYNAVASLTSTQADEQIATLQRARPALEENAKLLQERLASAFSQAQQTPLGDVGARALFNQLPTGELKTAYDEAAKALQENIDLETRLTQGRSSGAFATNDAIAAEEQLADIRQRNNQQTITLVGQQLAQQGQDIARYNSMTAEERSKEAESIRINLSSLKQYRDSLDQTRSTLDPTSVAYDAYTQAINSTDAEITRLTIQQNELAGIYSTTADIAEDLARQQQALSDQTDNYLDALEREGEVRDQIAQITQDIADTLLEKQQKLADAAADASDRIDQVEADAGERREQIAQDSADKIYKIERDFGRSRLNAIRDRDVDALIQARERRDDELEDQKKADEKALKQVDTALEKQEKSIKKSLDRQVQQIEQSYDRELAAKRRRLDQANVDLQNLLYAEQQIAMYGANNQRIIHTQMWQDVNAIAVTWAANTVNTLRSIFSQVMGTTGGSASPASMQYIDDRIRQRFADIFA